MRKTKWKKEGQLPDQNQFRLTINPNQQMLYQNLSPKHLTRLTLDQQLAARPMLSFCNTFRIIISLLRVSRIQFFTIRRYI